MKTYKKLLYSIGGGVISDAQRDEPNGSATIVIGLGGTGKDAIKRLKKEVYQRIVPNDNDGVYNHVKYLYIDSDAHDIDNYYNGEDTVDVDCRDEVFYIGDAPKLFAFPAAKIAKTHLKWFNPEINTPQNSSGSNGIRQIGRYYLIEKSDVLSRKLEEVFTSAVSKPRSRDVNIHIITGLGGGTGSGTFLDVCYIARRIASICPAFCGMRISIRGYFFMPDVYFSKNSSKTVNSYIMYNSYAAMKELDYCMGLDENGGIWRQQYNGFEISTSRPPVDVCCLVSSESVDSCGFGNGYEKGMGVVSDYIIQGIINDGIKDTHDEILFEKMIVERNRFNEIYEQRKRIGANYKYVIIGASHLIVPMREISTYLASKLFEKMAAAWRSNYPTDNDIYQFCEKIGLSFKNLKKDIGGFDISVPVVDNVYDQLPTDDSGDKYGYGYVLPENILAPFNKIQNEICGETLKKGHDALINEWKYGMNLDEDSISIVCRVYKALDEVVRDPNRGPFYAARMLFDNSNFFVSIINVISAIAQTAKAYRDGAYGSIDISVRAVKNARDAYNNKPKFFRKKEFQGLLMAIKNDIGIRCEYEQYKYLCDALDTAKAQLFDLYKNFFSKYADVILDLERVFEANKQAIAFEAYKWARYESFDFNTLDAEVDKLGIDTAIDEFNNAFYQDAYEIWRTGNDDEISRWISKYMSETFREYTEISMDDYFRNLCPALADSELVKRVREDIIKPLDTRADELFALDRRKMPCTFSITNCSAPITASIVSRAIGEGYIGKEGGMIRSSNKTNGIHCLKYTRCVPMFAYKFIDLCYDKYQNAMSIPGKHLYERTSMDGDSRNWQELLPDLRPYSIYQHMGCNTPDMQTAAEAYCIAEYEAGIIHSEIGSTGNATGFYYIWRTPNYMPQLDATNQLVDSAQKLVDTTVTKENEKALLKKLKAILPQLTTEQTNLKSYKEGLIDYKLTYSYDAVNNNQKLIKPEVPPVKIRNDGDNSIEAIAFSVRRDYVLASPVLMKVVKEELDKVNVYNTVMQQLEAVAERIKEKIDIIAEMIR